MQASKTSHGPDQFEFHRKILAALSDDLSLPLLQIKTTLESLGPADLMPESIARQTKLLASSAESGLQLIEAYRLALHTHDFASLEMEPVAIGSLLNEVAQKLEPYAKSYNTDLEVD